MSQKNVLIRRNTKQPSCRTKLNIKINTDEDIHYDRCHKYGFMIYYFYVYLSVKHNNTYTVKFAKRHQS